MVKHEIARLENVCCTWGRGHTLQNYNLTVFSGEILCIIGVSGSGKTAVEKLLLGETLPDRGRMFIGGKPASAFNQEKAFAHGICTIGTMQPMVRNFSIADNLEALRKVPNIFAIYNRKAAREHAAAVLDQLGLPYSPDKAVEELSFFEEQLLSIAKVVQCGARLIILNCVHNVYSDREARQLARLMTRLKENGISFLIFAERTNPFFEAADSIQVLSKGTDQHQWIRGTTPEALMTARWEGGMFTVPRSDAENRVRAVCLRDNRWDSKRGFPAYLQMLREREPLLWQTYMNFSLPGGEHVKSDDAVLIPSQSAALLAENLSIADNLCLCIPRQAGIGSLRILHPGMRKVLLREYQQLIRAGEDITQLRQLNECQKKILSIHRWALSNPKVLILEDPFWGLDRNEMELLHEYLLLLSTTDIRLVVFIRDARDMRYFSGPVITTKNGFEPLVISSNPASTDS